MPLFEPRAHQSTKAGATPALGLQQRKVARPPESKFGPFIQTVNRILTEHPAFRCGGNCEFVDNGHHAIIAAYRKEHAPRTGGYLVVCNFDIMGQQQIEIDLSSSIEGAGPLAFVELISGKELSFPSRRVSLTLPPSGAMVLQVR